jgi:membrane fusion protein, copper/silver efflux system
MKNYRTAFVVALVLAVVLAAGLVYVGWRYVWRPPANAASAAAPAETSGTRGASVQNSGQAQTSGMTQQEAKLVPIQLSPQRLQSIGVKSGVVRIEPVVDDIRTVGNVAVDERLVSYVQLRFSGWIQKVFVNSTYQYVRKGEPLFTIYSPDLVTTEQEYLIAKRNQNVLASSTVPGVAAGAVSLFGAAQERLRQWQVPAREIDRLGKTGRVSRELTIDSPASGYVTEYNAIPQLYAQPQTRLYTMANLSTVWVIAEFYQDQIAGISPGDPATVTVDSFPGEAFRGRVDFVYPNVDMTTRTVKVRLVFPNPGVRLKPGMFVNVDVKRSMGREMVIPASGVFQTGTQSIVFVDHGGGYLEPRTVTVGSQVGDNYIVLKGLKPGERVVSSANFLIDSESQLQAALGSFIPPPPGAGAAASMNTSQNNLQFSSTPSPPRKGGNTFAVKLTDSHGRPIAGAQVELDFLMPAMPAMGMAAMRASFPLTDSGGGNYRGQGQLPSGGTWQVSIVAKRNGRVIASKQLSISADGGM